MTLTSNQFDALASIPGDCSVYSIPQSFRPSDHSSPNRPLLSPPDLRRDSKQITETLELSAISPVKKQQDKLRFVVVNCNGAAGKQAEIANMCSYLEPDIIIMTETKIDSSVKYSEFLPSHYLGTIRKDRVKGGGGVMIAYRESLCVTEAEILPTEAEMVWARVALCDGSFINIGAYYRPPSDKSTSTIDNINAVLEGLNTGGHIILGGDFNAGDINWDTNTVKPGSDRRLLCERLITVLDDHHLEQIQREPTRKGALLDLFCTSRPSLVCSISTVPGISDHDIIVVDTDVRARSVKKPRRPIRKWSQTNWEAIHKDSEAFRDTFLRDFRYRDVEANYNAFQQHVEDMLRKYVPTKMSSTRTNVPWITPELRRMCRKKQRLYNRTKSTKNNREILWQKYSVHQSKTNKALRQARWNYINNILQEGLNEGSNKSFWKYIYSQKNDSKGVCPLKFEGKLHSDSRDKAEILNNQFVSVFTKDDRDSNTLLYGPSYPPIGNICV